MLAQKLIYHLRRDIFRSSLVASKQGSMTKALAKWQGLSSGIKWSVNNKKFTLRYFI